jgi:hypothetical protein
MDTGASGMVQSMVPCTQIICLEEMAGHNVGAESMKKISEKEEKHLRRL